MRTAVLIIAAGLALSACNHRHVAEVDPRDAWRLPQTAAGQAEARVARRNMEGVCGPIDTDQVRGSPGSAAGDYECRTKATKRAEERRR